MKRRTVIKTIALGTTVGIAGCSGDDGQSISTPEEDADPEELLPEPPEGWEQTLSNVQDASVIGAEASYVGNYVDSNGDEYAVEINRWSSESEAENDEYPSDIYSVHVANGNFTFAGRGADIDQLITLMANSSALTEDFIRDNNNL